MARYLLDPETEKAIQALAAAAPPMTEDQRARLARLLRLHQPRSATSRPLPPQPTGNRPILTRRA